MWSNPAAVRQADGRFRFTGARPADSAAMRRLAREAYGGYVDRIGAEPGPMTADYEAIAASGNALVVWREATLVGMLVTRLEEHALLVENVAVSPDVQGSGLGSTLLAEAERVARTTGRDRVRLYTHEAMVENLAFYARRGYRETHRRTDDCFPRVFLTKLLDQPR